MSINGHDSLTEWRRQAELSQRRAEELRRKRAGWSPPPQIYMFFVAVLILAMTGIYVMWVTH